MNNKKRVTRYTAVRLCLTALFCASAFHSDSAHSQDLPPVPLVTPDAPAATDALPELPSNITLDPMGIPVIPNPSNITQNAEPETITPLTPQAIPQVDASGTTNTAASNLPLPKNEEEFEFFQPGYQYKDDGPQDDGNNGDDVIKIAPEPPKPKAPPRLPLVRFNYKNQIFPPPIYRKAYNGENKHLPIAQYQQDYDAAIFYAASRNDVNGLRAMLNAGGRGINQRNPNVRSIEVRNQMGESLLEVAIRYHANDAVRFLLARGAEVRGAMQVARQSGNGIAVYALHTSGY